MLSAAQSPFMGPGSLGVPSTGTAALPWRSWCPVLGNQENIGRFGKQAKEREVLSPSQIR